MRFGDSFYLDLSWGPSQVFPKRISTVVLQKKMYQRTFLEKVPAYLNTLLAYKWPNDILISQTFLKMTFEMD